MHLPFQISLSSMHSTDNDMDVCHCNLFQAWPGWDFSQSLLPTFVPHHGPLPVESLFPETETIQLSTPFIKIYLWCWQ